METAIVLGTFDGLHEGHRAVLNKASGFYTVAVTFSIPPKAYLTDKRELLMSTEDKEAGLKLLGVDEIFTLDFEKIKNTDAKDFFEFLKIKFSPNLIACGFNYRFGKNALGDTALLKRLCDDARIKFCVAEETGEGEPISSSALRELIKSGDIKQANRHIYGGFGFTGKVIFGDKRGRELGFPTANQMFPENLVKPKFGVYKSKTIIDKKEYNSITNIGVRPTFKTDFIGCETFIGNFKGDIYGKEITVKFLEFLREEKKFLSAGELKTAVLADIKRGGL